MNKHYEESVQRIEKPQYDDFNPMTQCENRQSYSSYPPIDLSHLFPALETQKEQRKIKILKRWSLR